MDDILTKIGKLAYRFEKDTGRRPTHVEAGNDRLAEVAVVVEDLIPIEQVMAARNIEFNGLRLNRYYADPRMLRVMAPAGSVVYALAEGDEKPAPDMDLTRRFIEWRAETSR